MKLGEKQKLFNRFIPMLLFKMIADGYQPVIEYVFRCKDCPVGHGNSNHKRKLAIDIDLFWDGKWLTETDDHKPFGLFWESLHPMCRWGGRWGDGRHYSIEHNGVK